MAQHIPIQSFNHKRFKEIENSIRNAFKRGGVKGSLRFNFDRKLSEFYRANDKEEVYFTDRKIPKGIVYGSDWGSFEIHYNIETKELQIYLVA